MTPEKATRDEIVQYLASLLNISQYRDYCPNGLQVEGKAAISRIVSGVTASQKLIDAAIEAGADALLVHHGYFWKGETPSVVGIKQQRLKKLLNHNLNLFAYHLPLDAHLSLGNNAQLANKLDLSGQPTFGDMQLGWLGKSMNPQVKTVGDLVEVITQQLKRAPLVIGDMNQPLRQIGWCTGAAQSMLQDAINAGASVFISGEISEPTVHLAREMGVTYISAGHHATERYGVKALGDAVAKQFGIEHQFIDIDNPV